jgi:potassium voltage-gated channel Shab-related subfamily B protein 1
VTLTTLGYGDIYPTTIFGKIIGSLCAITSVFLLSMPMGLLAVNFQNNFKKHIKTTRILKIHFGKKRRNN